jgi:hypothetical protein
MNALYILIGALTLLIVLLFFSFIALLWGLRQLLTIRNQNDTMIALLQQVAVSIWDRAHLQAKLQEDNGDPAPTLERQFELHRWVSR